ncbi:MAG: hypothetical protein L3J34_02675 [Flavobacteriaceae bacterium]|nr:hypothetical protein [Flavobacteriaceae bacterium]
MQKYTKIQKATLFLIITYLFWELSVWYWSRSQPPEGGAIIRVDLIIIYPVLLVLILVSAFQYFKK